MNDDLEPYSVAAPRDAAVYDRPNVWSHKRVHVWGVGSMSACGRSVLTDLLLKDLDSVPDHARCRRSGCRERWPTIKEALSDDATGTT